MTRYYHTNMKIDLSTRPVAAIRDLDRCAITEYGIPGIVLMENAARQAAQDIWDVMQDRAASVWIFCGRGNNAGDGLAVARHLYNWGGVVVVVMVEGADKLQGDALTNYEIISKMGIDCRTLDSETVPLLGGCVVVDALLGTGLKGALRSPYAALVQDINRRADYTVSLDIPTGLDGDTGEVCGNAIKADMTITFAASKQGFEIAHGPEYCGDVRVKEISIPRQCYDRI